MQALLLGIMITSFGKWELVAFDVVGFIVRHKYLFFLLLFSPPRRFSDGDIVNTSVRPPIRLSVTLSPKSHSGIKPNLLYDFPSW